MISPKSQARLIGGLGDHVLPWKIKYRAHRKIKHAPALRSPTHDIPVERYKVGKTIHDRVNPGARVLANLMDRALRNAGRRCTCVFEEDAGLYFRRTAGCRACRGL